MYSSLEPCKLCTSASAVNVHTIVLCEQVHPKHPVSNFEALKLVISKLGDVGLEALTLQLRSAGGYIARSLSMEGVEFETKSAPMSPADAELYESCASLWEALFDVGAWNTAVYHSFTLRFFKALVMLIRLPMAIQTALEALEQGQQVIMTLVSTDEASIARGAAGAGAESAGGEGAAGADDAVATGVLLDCVLQAIAFARKQDGADKVIATLDELESRARALSLPAVGVLDRAKHQLARALGDRSAVTELTGRKQQLRCDLSADPSDAAQWRVCPRDESLLVGKQRFQEGGARVAFISSAASTGCSLHDVNGARRCVVSLELPYSPLAFIQQAGRAHRAGQRSAPRLVLVSCPGVEADSRFAAAISAKLAQLGAISRADRRDGAGPFDFGSAVDMCSPLANGVAAGVAASNNFDLGTEPTAVRLMNRCLAAGPTRGNDIMRQFRHSLAVYKEKERMGGKCSRVKEIVLDDSVTVVESFERHLSEGVRGTSVVTHYRIDHGLPLAAALKQIAASSPMVEFRLCKLRRGVSPSISPIALAKLVLHSDGSRSVMVVRPNGNKAILKGDAFERAYEPLDPDSELARELWATWYNKAGDPYVVGSRIKEFCFMSLPVIDWVASKSLNELKMTRIKKSDGSVVGMRFGVGMLRSVPRRGMP